MESFPSVVISTAIGDGLPPFTAALPPAAEVIDVDADGPPAGCANTFCDNPSAVTTPPAPNPPAPLPSPFPPVSAGLDAPRLPPVSVSSPANVSSAVSALLSSDASLDLLESVADCRHISRNFNIQGFLDRYWDRVEATHAAKDSCDVF